MNDGLLENECSLSGGESQAVRTLKLYLLLKVCTLSWQGYRNFGRQTLLTLTPNEPPGGISTI